MELSSILNAAIGILVSGGLWMLKNIQARLAKQDGILADQTQQLTTISTVLLGPTGENGLRSDVRENRRAMDILISRLDRAGIAQ